MVGVVPTIISRTFWGITLLMLVEGTLITQGVGSSRDGSFTMQF